MCVCVCVDEQKTAVWVGRAITEQHEKPRKGVPHSRARKRRSVDSMVVVASGSSVVTSTSSCPLVLNTLTGLLPLVLVLVLLRSGAAFSADDDKDDVDTHATPDRSSPAMAEAVARRTVASWLVSCASRDSASMSVQHRCCCVSTSAKAWCPTAHRAPARRSAAAPAASRAVSAARVRLGVLLLVVAVASQFAC